MLLTTKGVFRFDQETKEMYLSQIHPGVAVEDIQKEVPWDLKVSTNLTQTERPTDKEIDFVRKFAPTESVGRNMRIELSIENAITRARNRGKT